MESWDFSLDVNLNGAFNLTRLVLEHLVKVNPEETEDGERGVIIFISSAAAVRVYFHSCQVTLWTLSLKANLARLRTQPVRVLFVLWLSR